MPFYAVARGRKTGIFSTWEECQVQVHGYSNAKFKKFTDIESAFSNNSQQGNSNSNHITNSNNEREAPAAAAAANTDTTNQHNATIQVHAGSTDFACRKQRTTRVLLATALLQAKTQSGEYYTCRALLDDGSESSFITHRCATVLGLPRKKCNTLINGVSGFTAAKSQAKVLLTLKSNFSNFCFNTEALILPKVTSNLPSFELQETNWSHIRGLNLADPYYFEPREVDIILGADITAMLRLSGKVEGQDFSPIAFETKIGWILQGRVIADCVSSLSIQVYHNTIEQVLQKFWQLEEVPHREQLTEDERACEEYFQKTISRQADGRYITRLPFNKNIENLGASKQIATKRLLSIERKLDRQPDCRPQYQSFMAEYLSLDHMEEIPAKEQVEIIGKTNYLPHHCVVREDSSTTKLRVVFDGAAKTTSGLSINDCLYVGPNILPDIFDILVRFRQFPVVLKSDMTKCFRQFKIHEADRDFQRILWRNQPNEPIKEFRLKTVTYGTATGPYLANRCLKQLTIDEASSFPLATAVAKRDFYVDDLLTGVATVQEAISLQKEMTALMATAQLELRKWDSNKEEVLESIAPDLRESRGLHMLEKGDTNKALGVAWNSKFDVFVFTGYKLQQLKSITKRTVLSEMAKVFDPLGLLSPATIRIKIFFQALWSKVQLPNGEHRCLDWDDVLPPELQEEWRNYQENITSISNISIERCFAPNPVSYQELHGFSDASEKAYSAVVYLRSVSADKVIVRIVAAKTKVAPIKQVSLPRLELCGALLLSRLIAAVVKATSISCPIIAWSDSQITLRWIACSSRRWKTFVANRVAEIQEIIPGESWHYVPSEDNPADCASRGILAQELVGHKLWWTGPDWLTQNELPLFTGGQLVDSDSVEIEKRSTFVLCNITEKEDCIFNKYSSLSKLKRVVAFLYRFYSNSKLKMENRQFGHLTVNELEAAFWKCVRLAQHMDFAKELEILNDHNQKVKTGNLGSLNPFIDPQGLLRVGGRVKQPYYKHQVILNGRNPFTKLLIIHFHFELHHANFQLLWSNLARKFWILRARNAIRYIIRHCVICTRYRGQVMTQMMGQLPEARTTPSKPFSHSGVDFAGPIMLQAVKGRGKIQFKGYFCIFVCFSTKAVHLEAVTELSTDAFIATLKRFVSRRGIPSDIYSDQGTNFIGAEKELKNFVHWAKSDNSIVQYSTDHSIKWHFNPPAAPHQGGLWEAGVRSAKYHLRRIIGTSTLTLEEYFTLLAQVEAALNSRPLCALPTEPEDCNVLTPGHFLVGEPLNALPEPSYLNIKENRLSRWEKVQQMFQHFWNRWSKEYIHFLQQRSKWKYAKDNNIQVGDLVLVKEDNTMPLHWPMGKIIQVHPGSDNLVRVVTIKTKNGQLQRPIVKLIPLLKDESQQEKEPKG